MPLYYTYLVLITEDWLIAIKGAIFAWPMCTVMWCMTWFHDTACCRGQAIRRRVFQLKFLCGNVSIEQLIQRFRKGYHDSECQNPQHWDAGLTVKAFLCLCPKNESSRHHCFAVFSVQLPPQCVSSSCLWSSRVFIFAIEKPMDSRDVSSSCISQGALLLPEASLCVKINVQAEACRLVFFR